MTPSEEFVAKLCQQSFLSSWSTANPIGKERGKELCDVLVVCDPDIVIFSVKEIEYKATENTTVGMQRWTDRAVKASIKQIYGAERALGLLTRITARDGSPWLPLPPKERRSVHRVAVALGSKGEIPIIADGAHKGFVHVFDEKGISTVLAELDTITDFVQWLQKTEEFLDQTQIIMSGVEDLLGLYLHHGREYPHQADLMIVGDDLWSGVSAREEFKRRKEADRDSYFWDALIEHIAATHDPALTQAIGSTDDPEPSAEGVIRTMAREDRFSRRMLSQAFLEFHRARLNRSRMVRAPSGVVYVFLAPPHTTNRVDRRNELLARMFIARGMNQNSTTVVGIATEEYDPGKGSSTDAALYKKPEWTTEDQARMEDMQRNTGAFAKPRWTSQHVDEYPSGDEG